jgi:hypothetical protein
VASRRLIATRSSAVTMLILGSRVVTTPGRGSTSFTPLIGNRYPTVRGGESDLCAPRWPKRRRFDCRASTALAIASVRIEPPAREVARGITS